MKVQVRKCGARGFPWTVGCREHPRLTPTGLNSPVGFPTWDAAMRMANQHVKHSHS